VKLRLHAKCPGEFSNTPPLEDSIGCSAARRPF
jgi:hypothetical protein